MQARTSLRTCSAERPQTCETSYRRLRRAEASETRPPGVPESAARTRDVAIYDHATGRHAPCARTRARRARRASGYVRTRSRYRSTHRRKPFRGASPCVCPHQPFHLTITCPLNIYIHASLFLLSPCESLAFKSNQHTHFRLRSGFQAPGSHPLKYLRT